MRFSSRPREEACVEPSHFFLIAGASSPGAFCGVVGAFAGRVHVDGEEISVRPNGCWRTTELAAFRSPNLALSERGVLDDPSVHSHDAAGWHTNVHPGSIWLTAPDAGEGKDGAPGRRQRFQGPGECSGGEVLRGKGERT